jgi:mono/diheme cytochrome c family protein/enamine deaminase RidA (YjgF/YER057c/UK114 family)
MTITLARQALPYELAAGLLVMSTSPVVAQSSDSSLANPPGFMQRDGEAIYRASCQACHMPAGQGAVGAGAYPALAENSKLQVGRYPVYIVVNGAKAMPPFGKLLDDGQVAAVVNYVRTHFGNGYRDSVSAADVKAARPSAADSDSRAIRPGQLTFYGSPTAAIAAGVVIPPSRSWVWTSGTGPAVVKADAPTGSRERFGDTRTQATNILKNLAAQLLAQGLTLKDVVYLRAYLVPDAEKGSKIDMDGWSAAYKESFGTAVNQTKPARSSVGVAALANADWLIEIEAFAVFPAPP